jgi:hypothetical protein
VTSRVFYVLACAVLVVHALYIGWVIFGAALTRRRPLLAWFHIGCLLWGIWIEVGPWPCPLTNAENWLEVRAGIQPYQGGFLLHYLDKFVYPDIPPVLLIVVAVVVAIVNVGIYVRRFLRARQKKHSSCSQATGLREPLDTSHNPVGVWPMEQYRTRTNLQST